MQGPFVFGFIYLRDKWVLTVTSEIPRRELRSIEAQVICLLHPICYQ